MLWLMDLLGNVQKTFGKTIPIDLTRHEQSDFDVCFLFLGNCTGLLHVNSMDNYIKSIYILDIILIIFHVAQNVVQLKKC